MRQIDILIPEPLSVSSHPILSGKYRVAREADLWKQPDRLKEFASRARTLLVRNQTQVTSELLAASAELVAVGRLGVGLDNIDVKTASALGIVVIAPLNANAVSVAELSMGLMLALARKIPQMDRSTRAGGWDRQTGMGRELQGKTLAICGFGRIGRLVAQRAAAFGMALAIYDPYLPKESPEIIETKATLFEKLSDALTRADFVSVHLPLTQETRHLFNRSIFSSIKRGACFINTSRGGVLDEWALLESLKSEHLAGAALDVREIEPPASRIGLEELENVILLPHLGAATWEAQTRTFETVAADIESVLRGEPVRNGVNFAAPKRTLAR